MALMMATKRLKCTEPFFSTGLRVCVATVMLSEGSGESPLTAMCDTLSTDILALFLCCFELHTKPQLTI